jgi:sugar lactone lactonase YvrE
MEIARLVEGLPRCMLGEGPHWDVETQILAFVDTADHAIHRVSPRTGIHTRIDTDGEPGFVLFDTRGHVIAGVGDGIYDLGPDGTDRTLLAHPDMHPENRFNDAAVDPRGRLWAGTMYADASRDREPTGALYRIDPDGPVAFATSIGIANGLGWSPDGTTMYFAETHLGTVWAYDYDLATGAPSNRRAFAQVDREVGVPDGLTVDSAGRILVAIWRGRRINVYAADGTLERALEMPVPSATSCCLGGPDLRTLYITTDGRRLSGEAPDDPLPGCVLQLEWDVPGLPAPRMRPLR